MSQRKDINFQSQLESDCASLADLICKLLEDTVDIKFMRDPTRGGLAVALNDITRSTNLTIEIRQNDIPVNPTVQAAADVLGFDILNIANEGKFIAVIAADSAQKSLEICKNHPLGKDSSIIGQVKETTDVPLVEIETSIGGKRIVQMPYGRELPRIC